MPYTTSRGLTPQQDDRTLFEKAEAIYNRLWRDSGIGTGVDLPAKLSFGQMRPLDSDNDYQLSSKLYLMLSVAKMSPGETGVVEHQLIMILKDM